MGTQHQPLLKLNLADLNLQSLLRTCPRNAGTALDQGSPAVLTLSCMGAGTKRQQVTEGRLLSYMTTPAGSADPLLSGKSGPQASMFQLDLPAKHPKSIASSMPQGLQWPGHVNGAAEDGKAPEGLKVPRFACAAFQG